MKFSEVGRSSMIVKPYYNVLEREEENRLFPNLFREVSEVFSSFKRNWGSFVLGLSVLLTMFCRFKVFWSFIISVSSDTRDKNPKRYVRPVQSNSLFKSMVANIFFR